MEKSRRMVSRHPRLMASQVHMDNRVPLVPKDRQGKVSASRAPMEARVALHMLVPKAKQPLAMEDGVRVCSQVHWYNFLSFSRDDLVI